MEKITRYDLTQDMETYEWDVTPVPDGLEGQFVTYEDHAAIVTALSRHDATAGEPFAYSYRYAGCETCEGFKNWREEITKECPPDWMMETGKVTDLKALYTAAQPAVVPPEKIIEIMQSAWNEFCDDTGCYPDDFEYQNEQLFFDAGRWAMLVAERISILGAQPQKVVELPTQSEYEDPLSAYEALEHVKAALDAAGVKWEVKK